MKRLLAFLALVAVAHGAGSVQQSLQQLGNTNNWVLAFLWTGDASTGSVPVTVGQGLNCCTGYFVVQVETNPGTPNPTAGYSVAIQDSSGADVLNGAAASLSATAAQSFAASTSAPPLQGTLTLVITGQSVASAKGTVYVFLSKPGSINVATLGRGAIASSSNWLTLANSPVFDTRTYNYSSQTPGGSLPSGACSFKMFPVPTGLVTGGSVYIQGGVGTAEALTNVTVTGNTISGTCANTHSGAWTVQSATGGIQEATCAASPNGGQIYVISSLTLFANTTNCGLTLKVMVQRFPGAIISGAFTILGTASASSNSETELFPDQNWSGLSGINDATRISLGYPLTHEYGANLQNFATSFSGALSVPTGATSTANFGIFGYAELAGTGLGSAAGVGVGGAGAAVTGGAWGGNFTASNFLFGGVGNNVNLWGSEFDVNVTSGGTGPFNAFGITMVTDMQQQATNMSAGADVEKAAFTGHPSYPFLIAYRSLQGAAWTGLQLQPNIFPEAGTKTFATLPAAVAGVNTVYRCTDCTQANPTAGGGGGAFVNGVQGAWWGGAQPGQNANGAGQTINIQSYDPVNGNTGNVYMYTDVNGNFHFGATGEGTGSLISFESPNATVIGQFGPAGFAMGATFNITIPNIKSVTGQRYVCVTTTGQLVSSAAACSGT